MQEALPTDCSKWHKGGAWMEKIKIRNLKADEIECRIGTITDRGITLLLYKNARVDQAILDETFGIFGWQRHHTVIGGSLYCSVSVWDEEHQDWIMKQDVGSESDYEKEKGVASDSFKRACVNLGIGRELYTAPLIWVSADRLQIQERDHKKIVKDRFSVKSINISEDKVITALAIENQRRETVFEYKAPAKEEAGASDEEVRELYRELARTGVSEQILVKRYGVSSIAEMNAVMRKRALAGLKKTATAA